jgi:hypothetical protein
MGLSALDIAVIIVCLTGATLFGLRFRKRQRTLAQCWACFVGSC